MANFQIFCNIKGIFFLMAATKTIDTLKLISISYSDREDGIVSSALWLIQETIYHHVREVAILKINLQLSCSFCFVPENILNLNSSPIRLHRLQ